MADAGAAAAANDGAGAGAGARAGRLPRWTRHEILLLIQGKQEIDGRGRRGGSAAEPKWAAVAAYCRRNGVERGPVQCRKRWSNLFGDYRKIKEWEKENGGRESFWEMKNDARREKRLPGFFDKEVYDLLEGGKKAAMVGEGEGEEEEAVFDSRRTAVEEGLFSDSDDEEEKPEAANDDEEARIGLSSASVARKADGAAAAVLAIPAAPISEKKREAVYAEPFEPGSASAANKRPAEVLELGKKRRRESPENGSGSGGGGAELQRQLIEVLESNGRALAAHMEAENADRRLDREQRKDETDGLLSALNKLADAMKLIADKL